MNCQHELKASVGSATDKDQGLTNEALAVKPQIRQDFDRCHRDVARPSRICEATHLERRRNIRHGDCATRVPQLARWQGRERSSASQEMWKAIVLEVMTDTAQSTTLPYRSWLARPLQGSQGHARHSDLTRRSWVSENARSVGAFGFEVPETILADTDPVRRTLYRLCFTRAPWTTLNKV
ncbi:hypothetical protein JHW43_005285 [Diplocarpon mali]|nr:hypothetical protein JHW43_005285 [Diplocarpon mali]